MTPINQEFEKSDEHIWRERTTRRQSQFEDSGIEGIAITQFLKSNQSDP
jgi:hypothetical protein